MREAAAQMTDKDSMHVGVFVGSIDNCNKLEEVRSLISQLQIRHPTLPIETFVVPIPEDDLSAEMMRRALVENIGNTFELAHPREGDLN